MNQYIGQQFAVFRYEKNILIVEETASAGRCGSFNAASLCPASACRFDSAAWGFLYYWERASYDTKTLCEDVHCVPEKIAADTASLRRRNVPSHIHFHCLKGVNTHEFEIYLSRMWDSIGL